ncbi:DUF3106 domain-containing protein [Paucibacter sp. Y2R2-4]|uniref:DUF3106 domain-containing protein n=1 Tax=Paucibacter sp. Y2R2-4 TaxID=2893553 RepID=UPI0021E3FBF8|nr:DUF3106 domain-containing protein [Paucibacter sp. Y2R2-4]MCV2351768.1 DUF3106 domain-containing protein [Paucibacter sp. Y2R2-4]
MSKSDGLFMRDARKSLNLKDSVASRHKRWSHGLLATLGLAFVSAAWCQQEAQTAEATASAATSTPPAVSPAAELSRPKPAAIAPTPAAAVTGPARLLPAPNWPALSPAQRQILAPLEADWNDLDAARKSQWLEVATRFSSLAPEDQGRMQERMRDWARLSPAQRQEARIGFQVAKKIDADARQAKWEAYQALPAEQRQHLAEKAAQKQEQQSSKLLSSAIGKSTVSATQAKSNLVPASVPGLAPKPVAASLLQAKPGATTVLMTSSRFLTAHQQAGETKILAQPEMVDSKTLLPKKRNIDTKPTS